MTLFHCRTCLKQLLLIVFPLIALLASIASNNGELFQVLMPSIQCDSIIPESAHSYIRNYRINQLSPTLDYVSDRVVLSTENSDGRYVSGFASITKPHPAPMTLRLL